MGMDFLNASSAFDTFNSFVKTGYGIYQDLRDFNYRSNLQDEIFSREDNAVQRRKADLEAAGMNPFMAAGSAAGAGSAVNISSKDIGNPGSVLDSLMAVQAYKKMKAEATKANEDAETAKYFKEIAHNDSTKSWYDTLDRQDVFYFNRGFYRQLEKDEDGVYYIDDTNKFDTRRTDVPFYNLLQYQIDNSKNSADLLQKQNEYYSADKIMNYLGSFVPFLNFGNNYLNRR